MQELRVQTCKTGSCALYFFKVDENHETLVKLHITKDTSNVEFESDMFVIY